MVTIKERNSIPTDRCPECNKEMDRVKDNKFKCRTCGTVVEVKK